MAVKRNVSKGGKKPVGGRTEQVIRRAMAAADKPTPVELRAEREPAVVVAPSVTTRHEMDDWAPAPVRVSWWERIRSRMVPQRESKAEMAEQMAAVKASVLQELETLGVKKGVAVKGSPFSSVLLPVKTKKRPSKWWALGAAAVLLIGIMVWVGSKPAQPETVLNQAINAVRTHDVRAFETRVDVAVVAASMVNQIFNIPQQAEGGLAARMTAFAKPGLAEGLKDEILAAVSGQKLDDSGNTLLGKLWHALGAGNLRVGAPRVAIEDEHMIVAEVPLQRHDLGLTLPLQVVMTRASEGADWQVVDMPNLGALLETVAGAERVLAERRAKNQQNLANGADIRVESVKKAKDTLAGSSNLIVSMVLANVGTGDGKDVDLDVAFGDAAGQPMMTTRVRLDGQLAAGARREQVWSVPVDRERAAERYVADLPLSALTVTVTVVK